MSISKLPLYGIWNFAMFMKDWTEHSDGFYFYKSKNRNQRPPDEVVTKNELLFRFFGMNLDEEN